MTLDNQRGIPPRAGAGNAERGSAGCSRGCEAQKEKPRESGAVVFMRSFRRLVRSMVFMVCLPAVTAELEVTTIDVAVALVTLLPTILGGEGGRSSHGRKSDRDDKKRFHGSFSRLRAEASAVASQSERRPVRGWMALTVMSFHPTVQRSTHASNRRTVHRNYTLV
jgi:hypothetical protein